MSSFDGYINELPEVSVDNFQRFSRAYFLSHCHRDHMHGLSEVKLRNHLQECNVKIYTSELSAAIIATTACFADVKEHVEILKLGKPQLIKLESTENHGELYLEVTTIPAGHCVGSVMYLFKTANKTVLFTGDFRLGINDVSKLSTLHSEKHEPLNLDTLYVDTTFLNVQYENFPKRTDSVKCVVNEIKDCLKRGTDVAVHTSARFGYEYVFNEIFKVLGVKVYVGSEDWTMYGLYPHLIKGVTNIATNTRIHKCRNRSEHKDHTTCLPLNTTSKKFIYVHLSAMKWDNYELDDRTFSKVSENRIDACFATHCSRSELINFVTHFSPAKVVGFPNAFKMAECGEMAGKVTGFDVVFRPPKRRLRSETKSKKLKCVD